MAEARLRPVEELILSGVAKRFQQVFDCLPVITNTYEKVRVIKQLFDGKPVVYPFATIIVRSVYPNTESWNTNYMARRGLQAVVHDSNNAAYTVRLLPTCFDLDIEYHTNQFNLGLSNSVLAFAKNWLFARRNGYMKFDAQYGRLNLKIQSDLDANVVLPTLENTADEEPVYVVRASMTVKGYMSQAELGTIGIVQDVEVTESYQDPPRYTNTTTSEPVFWAVPKSRS